MHGGISKTLLGGNGLSLGSRAGKVRPLVKTTGQTVQFPIAVALSQDDHREEVNKPHSTSSGDAHGIKAPRLLKRREGKYWTLYGCYPRQGGYESRPGYEGVACSDDGLTWRRAKDSPILAVQDADCGTWERDCIYQPWLVEDGGRFPKNETFFLYYCACGSHGRGIGLITSKPLQR